MSDVLFRRVNVMQLLNDIPKVNILYTIADSIRKACLNLDFKRYTKRGSLILLLNLFQLLYHGKIMLLATNCWH